MGGEGQCTVPGGCKILLSPLKSSDKSNCTVSNEVCCGINDISLSGPDETHAVTQKKGCGWRNGDDTRILSDNDSTSFAEFPWVVAVLTIQNKDPDDPTSSKIFLYTCGGALIHPRVVMTTAHHVYKSNLTLRIRAGEWDTSSTEEVIPYQDRNVERVIIHEKFNTVRLNLHYDIALLVLSNPLNLAPNVNPICLPPPMESPARATRCISSGWGKNDFGKEGRYQVILKKVELPVVDKAACQRSLRQTRLGVFFKLHSSFMCAGGEPGRDTCKGDGGSPLVCPIPNQMGRYMASGIVAWGVGCGEAIPAVYVDVANMRSWIDDKVIGLGFTTAAYTF
ncbi:phenoloxidase-activating factor 2-like [Battus philenor]|uniref:phenoloxidase-activating factor 2-like n=1 Tax=Battus philenor TaxID=42288 RepID=UPI0035D0BDBD